jgi:hypothetical protein
LTLPFVRIAPIPSTVAPVPRVAAAEINHYYCREMSSRESAEQWNATNPPGTRVRVTLRGGETFEDATAGHAQQWGDFALLGLQARKGLWTTRALTRVDQPVEY